MPLAPGAGGGSLLEIVPSGSQGSFPGGGSVLVVGIDVGAVVVVMGFVAT